MTLVSLTLPNDGETIDASDVNSPFNAIASVINGNIDDQNISSVSGTKINAGTIPFNAFNTAAQTQLNSDWRDLGTTFSSVTYLGNKLYTIVTAADKSSVLSAGAHIKGSRTVAAPTQCTSLNGTTQYYSKTSPAGMTFTDDFVVSAWVKLGNYQAGTIASRYNGTSGWALQINASGQVGLVAYNAGAANYVYALSYQSIPMNKWVHIAAQLDMSSFTASATTCYLMIDGVDIPVNLTRGGTNPIALVQAGNLEVGSQNAGTFWAGKIAQVAIYSAKVTQANVRATISQGLSGSETSLIAAYSFNNSINDLNANANNLTANGSAVATNADSPFGGQADGTISSTLDYLEVLSISGTTIIARSSAYGTIPTTGFTSLAYASSDAPYGMPDFSKILGYVELRASVTTTSAFTFVQALGLTAPVYIPSNIGSNGIRVSAFIPRAQHNATNAYFLGSIWDGPVGSGTQLVDSAVYQANAGNTGGHFDLSAVVYPLPGNKTYNFGFAGTTSNTTSVVVGTTSVGYIMVEQL